MKVIYTSVLQLLDEAIADATMQNKTIRHIELTPAEMKQLGKELRSLTVYCADSQHDGQNARYRGVTLKEVP